MNFAENYMNSVVGTVHIFEKKRGIATEELTTNYTDWEKLEEISPSVGPTEIGYDEAVAKFRESDLSQYNEIIVTNVARKSNFICFMCRDKTQLKKELIDEYNLLFLTAKCPYNDDDDVHRLMLKTVYSSLRKKDDLNYNWENIGFQSDLPWTDLRGVGMLGVLQLLYLCTNLPRLASMLYEISKESNSFPLAAVSLNVTSIVLNTVRNGKLTKQMNKRGVFEIANETYAAIFYNFGQTWKKKQKNISHLGCILRDLEKSIFSARRRKLVSNFYSEYSNNGKAS